MVVNNHYPKLAVPPYDIRVRHTEWRTFSLGGTKFAPAYYHVNLPCLQKNWPSFNPAFSLVIEPVVFQKLDETHINFLRAFGCYI